MFTIIIRATIIYIFVIMLFRIMGKRQIGQMQPFEFVLTLIIADLATIPMAENGIPLTHGLIPLLTLVVLHFLITFVSRKSKKVGELISGKPIVVIYNGNIDTAALTSLNLSIEDLSELLRNCGFFKIEDVAFAIMETNGTMNAMAKQHAEPVTKSDLNIKLEKSKIEEMLIAEGHFNSENMKQEKISRKKILNFLKSINIKDEKNIVFLSLSNDNYVSFQEKDKDIRKEKFTTNTNANTKTTNAHKTKSTTKNNDDASSCKNESTTKNNEDGNSVNLNKNTNATNVSKNKTTKEVKK